MVRFKYCKCGDPCDKAYKFDLAAKRRMVADENLFVEKEASRKGFLSKLLSNCTVVKEETMRAAEDAEAAQHVAKQKVVNCPNLGKQ